MKPLSVLLVVSIFCTELLSQFSQPNPVTWNFNARKIGDKTFEVHMTATVGDGWHLYSQSTPKNGPLPTTISFPKNPLIILSDNIKEIGSLEMKYEDVFNVEVWQYSEKVDFVQVVKLKSNVKTNITGTVTFMTCNDERCLPPTEIKFSIKLE